MLDDLTTKQLTQLKRKIERHFGREVAAVTWHSVIEGKTFALRFVLYPKHSDQIDQIETLDVVYLSEDDTGDAFFNVWPLTADNLPCRMQVDPKLLN
jgi:hypothetical protein